MLNNKKFSFIQNWKEYDLYNLPDGFVVTVDVNISNRGLTELPDLANVTFLGKFDCSNNLLTSLKGAPKEVKVFDCSGNKLTSLEYGPVKAEEYYCGFNGLVTLKGAPKRVRVFSCPGNNLTSLKYGPVATDVYHCFFNKLPGQKTLYATVNQRHNIKTR